jgi:hypothetical protein
MVLDICAWPVAFAWVKGVVKSLTSILAFRCKSKLEEVRAAGEGDPSTLQGLHKACAEMITPLMNKHAAKKAADKKSACSVPSLSFGVHAPPPSTLLFRCF